MKTEKPKTTAKSNPTEELVRLLIEAHGALNWVTKETTDNFRRTPRRRSLEAATDNAIITQGKIFRTLKVIDPYWVSEPEKEEEELI